MKDFGISPSFAALTRYRRWASDKYRRVIHDVVVRSVSNMPTMSRSRMFLPLPILEIMESFAEACSEYGNVEKPAKLENRTMLMFLAAKTAKK